jgi:hypothetical protein
MSDINGTDGHGKRVSSLGQLAQPMAPPRDLWPAIAAEISKTPAAASQPVKRSSRLQWVAAAAVVCALAVGMWIGRNVLPVGTPQPAPGTASNTGSHEMVSASYVTDPRYLAERATLISGLEKQLKSLPPKSQQKVAASLATIRQSMSDIQAALGRDPGNALLQELLVNTYQDEMRVLSTVHEASDSGQEI